MSARERLVESMRELLWERGYVGTSPKAILHRAAAGQGSMYHHFAGKADLAHAAIERTAQEMQDLAEAELAIPGTAVERIARYLRRERDVLRGCPIGGLTQDPDVMANPALRAPVERTLTWLRVRLADVIADGRRHDELDAAMDPLATAATIVAVLQGGYVLARAAGTTDPFDEAIDGILALLGAHTVSDPHSVGESG
ncbi:MAG TPA: TetR/AcrR family transcriptional regulator [Acidothermaceae bacterium]|nr:TetR/AcrR family transcriptional regulator [Acidothermaceae bacterium]